VSTHRQDDAERVCDRFGQLHQGQLRLEGTLEELRTATGCPTLVDMFRSFFLPVKIGEVGVGGFSEANQISN
jgi:ABC-type multidrug transport system ATPase subunit